jgi:uncharacterized iron-regulated protein
MRYIMALTKKSLTVLALAALLFSFTLSTADAVEKIDLKVDIDIKRSQISGTSTMNVTAGEDVVLKIGTLHIDEVKLNGRLVNYDEFEGTVKVAPQQQGELTIRYAGIFKDSGSSRYGDNPAVDNIIGKKGVSLTNIWYPAPGGLCNYDLTASFPSGYTAISEAEDMTVDRKEGKTEYHFRFPYKVDGINLIASDRFSVIKDEFREIEIYAYFFPEDSGLAKKYIEYTKKYLELYEDLIGMYPYKRFSIVENFLPTGYSMPTYTLLGNMVVRLPFIVETSLGHEILHQWFGNSVYIDYESGNWGEGLTTYLADHLYRENKGEGWQYRKQILVDYRSYVTPESDIPLKYFTGRVDRPSRAIGYGKVAMVFHMLKELTGKETFYLSLRDFIEQNRFRKASWNDIQASFEKNYSRDMSWFFNQWTRQSGLPELTLYDAELQQTGKEYNLHFHVRQEDNVYKLKLPVTIYFKERLFFDSLEIDAEENSFDLVLPHKPYRIAIDEDYDVARGIGKDELPPVVARLLGNQNILVAVPEGEEKTYGSIIEEFTGKGAVLKTAGDVIISDIEEHSLIMLDIENPLTRRLFGSINKEEGGAYLVVKNNPWNEAKVAAVFHAKSKEEADAALRKIPHYGKYSTLVFNKGVNSGKSIKKTERGMVMELEHEAAAIEVSSVKTLSDVIKGVEDRKIIYVGEIHDVFAHHAVQLDIITGIYRKHPQMAIGMEMFQRPFQETLDDFIEGRIGQMAFLKQSEYFKRWGFDYSLYKPILDFAREEKIPVIALNLQKELITKVSHNGIDALSDEEKKEIPEELDFSDNEYRGRLKEIFSMHTDADKKDFNNFYQSQILWDETMSLSIDAFLKGNPDKKIVVLAGQGHLRYGSGIPKRTFRRNGHDYGVVLIDDEVHKDIADYVVFPKPVEGITTPKLMVFLNITDDRIAIAGFPDKSVSEEAGIQAEDIILSLDDVEVKTIEDIKIFLMNKKKGNVVKVKVLRKEEDSEKEMLIDVTL